MKSWVDNFRLCHVALKNYASMQMTLRCLYKNILTSHGSVYRQTEQVFGEAHPETDGDILQIENTGSRIKNRQYWIFRD